MRFMPWSLPLSRQLAYLLSVGRFMVPLTFTTSGALFKRWFLTDDVLGFKVGGCLLSWIFSYRISLRVAKHLKGRTKKLQFFKIYGLTSKNVKYIFQYRYAYLWQIITIHILVLIYNSFPYKRAEPIKYKRKLHQTQYFQISTVYFLTECQRERLP